MTFKAAVALAMLCYPQLAVAKGEGGFPVIERLPQIELTSSLGSSHRRFIDPYERIIREPDPLDNLLPRRVVVKARLQEASRQ